MNRKNKILVLVGLTLLIAGSLLLISIIRSRESSITAAPPAGGTHQTVPATIKGSPVKLEISSLGMNLPIIPGYYNARSKTWTLSLDKVQYATMTPEPNNGGGNTFLYGHYRREVFARLHTIPADSEAVVTTDNGHKFYYKLNGVQVVNPNDSAAIFNYQGPPMLTIQTCTGIFFQNRQLFTFSLEKVV